LLLLRSIWYLGLYNYDFLQLTLYRVFDTRAVMFMIHEMAAKGNIESNVPQSGMSEAQCRQLMGGIVSGLQFIHKHNIVHRYTTNRFCYIYF